MRDAPSLLIQMMLSWPAALSKRKFNTFTLKPCLHLAFVRFGDHSHTVVSFIFQVTSSALCSLYSTWCSLRYELLPLSVTINVQEVISHHRFIVFVCVYVCVCAWFPVVALSVPACGRLANPLTLNAFVVFCSS